MRREQASANVASWKQVVATDARVEHRLSVMVDVRHQGQDVGAIHILRAVVLPEVVVERGSAVQPVGTFPHPLARIVEGAAFRIVVALPQRSEEHTSELQSLMRTSYAVFCLKKKKTLYRQ